MYVLLLYLSTYYSGVSFSAEFSSLEHCQQAAEKMIELRQEKINNISRSSFYTCLPK